MGRTRGAAKQRRDPDPAAPPADDVPPIDESRARKEAAAAALAELELEKAKGSVVAVSHVEARFAKFSTELRTKMLGAPSRARQYLPARFTREDAADIMEAFSRAQRELLEDAATRTEEGEFDGG